MKTRLPFSVTTTKHGLLIIADDKMRDLYTYCPIYGVMRGLGDFDDNPLLYEPLKLQLLLNASDEDLGRMKREWELAARKNTRFIGRGEHVTREDLQPDALLPFIAELSEPSFVRDSEEVSEMAQKFVGACTAIEEA